MATILKLVLICATFWAAACGGSSPSRPTPPPTTPPVTVPPPLVLSGAVTATNGGQPLADVTVEAASITSTTDGGGRYSLSFPAGTTPPSRFAIMGTALVRRTGFLANGSTRTLDLDAFALDTFDLAYFRAIARNGWEQPSTLQPLRRWTRAPMIYIRTVDDTGRPIIAEVLQQVVSIVSSVVPLYTNGRFGVAALEQGVETRRGQAGWITIDWTRDASQFCGQASVGAEGGFVTLTYDQPGCSCGSQKIRPRTVKHELGHSLGLWHSGQGADLMSGIGVSECDRNITARELRYLDYLYRRAVGNTDPDNDPSSAAVLALVRATN